LDCGDRNLGFPCERRPRTTRADLNVNLKSILDFTADYNPVAGGGDAIADQKPDLGV
jgi:hypothetical protein